MHGASAAARYFTRKLHTTVSRSTVKSIRDLYLIEVKRKRQHAGSGAIDDLPEKKRGRKLLLGEHLDEKLQLYIRKTREGGGAVTTRIVMAAARGLLLASNRNILAEYGGDVRINRPWAQSLLERMGYVKRKATTSKGKYSLADFEQVKKQFLKDVTETVLMEEIPPELVLNWDQTGINIVPASLWTMDQQGKKRVEMIGLKDKRQITAVFCASIQGDFLPIQLIFKGKTSRCHPNFKFPEWWHITHSPKRWSNEEIMLQYIDHIVLPYINGVREMLGDESLAALVVMDNFKGQTTEDENVHVVYLPPNATDLLQPLDISINKPAKSFLKCQFEEWYAEEIFKQLRGSSSASDQLEPVDLSLPVMKELCSKWILEMFEYISANPQMTVKGFIRAGISKALDEVLSYADSVTDDVISEQDVSESSSDNDTDSDDSSVDHDTDVEESEDVIVLS